MLVIVRRWDWQRKRFVEINCPAVVDLYNKSMDGVDLLDIG